MLLYFVEHFTKQITWTEANQSSSTPEQVGCMMDSLANTTARNLWRDGAIIASQLVAEGWCLIHARSVTRFFQSNQLILSQYTPIQTTVLYCIAIHFVALAIELLWSKYSIKKTSMIHWSLILLMTTKFNRYMIVNISQLHHTVHTWVKLVLKTIRDWKQETWISRVGWVWKRWKRRV